jgi:VanZ family protein
MPISRCNSVGFQLVFAIAMLIASVAMLSPTTPKVDIEFDYLDKLVHLSTFAILAFLLDSGWSTSPYSIKKWGALLFYGIAIEIAQHYIPNRGFEWMDWVADGAGLVFYGFFILPLLRRLSLR